MIFFVGFELKNDNEQLKLIKHVKIIKNKVFSAQT